MSSNPDVVSKVRPASRLQGDLPHAVAGAAGAGS
jgi:hypothetical protein